MDEMLARWISEAKAKTDPQWIAESRMFAEEMLEEELLETLEKSERKMEIYKSIARAGKQTYETQLRSIAKMNPTGMDALIAMETATDYKMESMKAVLADEMERLIPGFKEMYQ